MLWYNLRAAGSSVGRVRFRGMWMMGISRKDALRRLAGLEPQVDTHLQKIADNPESEAVDHWQREIRTFLAQMEALLPHVGKTTGATWKKRIAEFTERLGDN